MSRRPSRRPRGIPPVSPARRVTGALLWLAGCGAAAAAYLGVSTIAYALAARALVGALRALGALEMLSSAYTTVSLIMQVAVQAVCAVFFFLWWRYLDGRSFARRLRRPLSRAPRDRIGRVGALAVLGIALQMLVSLALTVLFAFIPDVMEGYSRLMEESGTSDFSALSVLVLSLGAPILEELLCRGVIGEFALRAFCPEWRGAWCRRGTPPRAAVPAARFWLANGVQALIFGLLHGNIVQTSYAFVLGLVLGWVLWQTGRLRYCMLLHALVNLSSFAVSALWDVLMPLGLFGMTAVLAVGCVWSARLFVQSARPRAGLLPAAGQTAP